MYFLNKSLIVVALMACCSPSWATSVESLQKHSLNSQASSKQSQLEINKIDDQLIQIRQQVKALQDESENLELYNRYLQRLLTDQEAEQTSLDEQIVSVKETRQGIVPLMVRMLENLERFVELDAPLLAQERKERLTQLQNMMAKADVSEAEKYRRLLGSYVIEAEYGNKMGQYQASLMIDGQLRTVNYFYLGRIVFVAVSLDGHQVWTWDRQHNQWLSIDPTYARGIEKAIRISNKTDIPALLELPLLSEVN